MDERFLLLLEREGKLEWFEGLRRRRGVETTQ
jgi:hypothetical protein